MDPLTFCDLIERLTGTPVKHSGSDSILLSRILNDDSRFIGYSQFNELLLLVNKNRVSAPFFKRFFDDGCKVAEIAKGVERFQIAAMLRYGNFIFAYRTLSKIVDQSDFERELGNLCTDGNTLGVNERAPQLLKVENIPRDDTALVGYLSATQLVVELERCKLLAFAAKQVGGDADWATLRKCVEELTKPDARGPLLVMIESYRQTNNTANIADFATYLETARKSIQSRHDRMLQVQEIAIRNQDIYLTWDHMDVYFATSMRKAWEFTDLYDFVNGLMSSKALASLQVRYFDPTQSYTKERVDKGLVESLMLKRARCTVYSVQDTDTLGKDSELAATLAQGKPVIAYVPSIDEEKRIGELLTNDPLAILDRLRFVLYADEKFLSELSPEDRIFVEEFRSLNQFASTVLFRSVTDESKISSFREQFKGELLRLCTLIAASEKRIYDSRANTLKRFHPLGIQVNLDTGVANGVLVVRTLSECATLLVRILTNSLDFVLEDEKAHWSLRETISGSIFRVVTKNAKVNNCFWNFYLNS